jgi:hypothetical protein
MTAKIEAKKNSQQCPRHLITANNLISRQISRVKKEDEDWYECQISTAKPIGRMIYLKVIGEKKKKK